MNKNLLAFSGIAFLLVTAGAVGQASMPGAGVEPNGLAAGSVATCSLPAHYAPLIEVTVTITVTPDAGVVAQAIQDAPPAGWTVRAASITEGGIWDGVTGRVKWGPFFDNTARTLQYAVTPPAGATGTAVFVGTASFDGVNQAIGGSRTITPIPPTPVITWANPASIVYGTLLTDTQLNATASVVGVFDYTPKAGTKLNAGAGQILSVTFTPADTTNYSTATKTVTIDVTKATPVITWANPAAITHGTALSGVQLNATGSVAGVLVYTPVSGTVLAVGTHTLSTTLTPTDTANHTTATKTVTIDVTSGANPPAFTDDPLQPGVTPAKVVHLTELRQAINTLRAQFNLGSFAWTDATLLPGVTAIKAVHLVELRAALDAVYVAAGRLVPTYTHTTVTGGATVITALDIAELRAAVLAIW
jgi:hypothetical protein